MIWTIALGIVLGVVLLIVIPILIAILPALLLAVFGGVAIGAGILFYLGLLAPAILSIGLLFYAFVVLETGLAVKFMGIVSSFIFITISSYSLLRFGPFWQEEARREALISSMMKKIMGYYALLLVFVIIIIGPLFQTVIPNLVIKPHTINKKQQEYDSNRDLAPVDSELDIPVRYLNIDRMHYVLSIGRGCGSCHAEHLQVFDENNVELLSVYTEDAFFDVAFTKSFSIKQPIRIDGEGYCCPSRFYRRYFEFDKTKGIFVEKKPWWAFFLEDTGSYPKELEASEIHKTIGGKPAFKNSSGELEVLEDIDSYEN